VKSLATGEKGLRLVFGKHTLETETTMRPLGGESSTLLREFSVKLEEFVSWFKELKIDSIELWIEGGAKTGAITELFISLQGKGGCKVTLKPK
jgi:hypothetical protein